MSAFEEQRYCGYARCREDGGFGVYVCDCWLQNRSGNAASGVN
jgi:hypothetical protein